jgi:hypothetical protein
MEWRGFAGEMGIDIDEVGLSELNEWMVGRCLGRKQWRAVAWWWWWWWLLSFRCGRREEREQKSSNTDVPYCFDCFD